MIATVVCLAISMSQYFDIRKDSGSKVYDGEWVGDSFENLELNYPELVDDVKKYYDYLDTKLNGVPFSQEYNVYKERYDTLGDRYVEFVFAADMFIESEEIHIEVSKAVSSSDVKLTIQSDHGASPDKLHPDILQVYAQISGESLDEMQRSIQLAIDEYESQDYKPQENINDGNFNVHYYMNQENQLRTSLDLVKNLELK